MLWSQRMLGLFYCGVSSSFRRFLRCSAGLSCRDWSIRRPPPWVPSAMHVYTRDQLIALRRFAAPFHDVARRAVLSAGGVPRHRRLRGCRADRRKQAAVNCCASADSCASAPSSNCSISGEVRHIVDELRHTETLATAPSSSQVTGDVLQLLTNVDLRQFCVACTSTDNRRRP